MVVFIFTEVLFFFGFFWCYFHCCSVPADVLGCTWASIVLLDPWCVPVMNTLVLVGSGVLITWVHMDLIGGNDITVGLACTVLLGVMFLCLQCLEYYEL